MSDNFSHAYALLVGVGQSANPAWSLPVTVKDMQALRAILTDPGLCSYPDDDSHIRLLHDGNATRKAVLDGLTWLAERATGDGEATIVVYYSGHGWLNIDQGNYYLLPHDVDKTNPAGTALPAEQFTEALRKIQAKRLLVFMDCCHAAGMATSKDAALEQELPSDFTQVALPKGLVEELKQGQGRAVFSSSSGKQKSWIRQDRTLSLYTYHLIEALHGAGSRPGETVVHLSDLMYYLGKTVPESAQAMGKEQTPFADLAAEDFPVALLRGGKGLPGDPLEAVKKETERTVSQLIQAGVFIGGDVDTGGGDFVGRDCIVHGDEVHGDKIGGDKIGGDKVGGNKISMTASGDRSVVIGGNMSGSTIITGDRSASREDESDTDGS
jgi:hypothetical protein